MRRRPSNWNGLVTTPTVSAPSSRAIRAITGAEPVPVPPPIPAVTNTISASDRISRMRSSSSSAALRPISGLPPVPRPRVISSPICMRSGAWLFCSAWMSVLTAMKSTLRSPTLIMWLTALPPHPPAPITLILAPGSGLLTNSIITDPPPPPTGKVCCPLNLLFRRLLKRSPLPNRQVASAAVRAGPLFQLHFQFRPPRSDAAAGRPPSCTSASSILRAVPSG